MIPNATKQDILADYISGKTFKVALLKETTEYTPDPDAHDFVSDVLDGGTTGEEYDDTNYSRQTLSNVTATVDDTNDLGVVDADDVTFTDIGSATGGQTVEAILVYEQVGVDDTTPGDDPVVRIADDSELADLPKQTNGEDFVINWDATDGVFRIS